jgi:hypothetical protein
MDTFKAFAMGRAATISGNSQKIFDWNKAAQILKDKKAKYAEAGLEGDWEYTGGTILLDGKPFIKDNVYTYLSSNWATPQLELDGETIDCFIYEDDNPNNWDSGTYWPQSALDIFNKK